MLVDYEKTIVRISTNRRTGRVHCRVNGKVFSHHDASVVVNRKMGESSSRVYRAISDKTHNREYYGFST